MSDEEHELLEMAYETLQNIDRDEILAISEKYMHGKSKNIDLKEVKIIAAYCVLNGL